MQFQLHNKEQLINCVQNVTKFHNRVSVLYFTLLDQNLYWLLFNSTNMSTDVLNIICEYSSEKYYVYCTIYEILCVQNTISFRIAITCDELGIHYLLYIKCTNNKIVQLQLFFNNLNTMLFSKLHFDNKSNMYYRDRIPKLNGISHVYLFNLIHIINIFMKKHNLTVPYCDPDGIHTCKYVFDDILCDNKIISPYLQYTNSEYIKSLYIFLINNDHKFTIMSKIMAEIINAVYTNIPKTP